MLFIEKDIKFLHNFFNFGFLFLFLRKSLKFLPQWETDLKVDALLCHSPKASNCIKFS